MAALLTADKGPMIDFNSVPNIIIPTELRLKLIHAVESARLVETKQGIVVPSAAQLCDVVPPKIYDRYDLDRYFAIKVRTENETYSLKSDCNCILKTIMHVEELALDYKYRVFKCREQLESNTLPIIQYEEEKLTDMLGFLGTHLAELNRYVAQNLLLVSSSVEVMRVKLNQKRDLIGYDPDNDWPAPALQEERDAYSLRNYTANRLFDIREVDRARHAYLDKVAILERELKELIKRLLEYKEHKAETEAVRKFIDDAIEKAFQELKKGTAPVPAPVPAPAPVQLVSLSGEEMMEAYNRSVMMEAHVYTEDAF